MTTSFQILRPPSRTALPTAVSPPHSFPRPRQQLSCRAARNLQFGSAFSSRSFKQQSMTTQHRVHFTNPDQQQLIGLLVDAGSNDVCILCHGYAGSKDGGFFPDLAAALAEKGQSSLRFDFNGNGESEGEFKYAGYWQEAEDLRSAVEWLKQQGRPTIGIAGHSKAGSVMLMYTAKYGDVPRVACISGRYNLSTGITERFGKATIEKVKTQGPVLQKIPEKGIEYWLTQESIDERIAIGDMQQFCQAVPPTVSVLNIHGEADQTIAVMDAIKYAHDTRGAVLRTVQGADHSFTDRGARRELLDYVVPFLCGQPMPQTGN